MAPPPYPFFTGPTYANKKVFALVKEISVLTEIEPSICLLCVHCWLSLFSFSEKYFRQYQQAPTIRGLREYHLKPINTNFTRK